MSTWPQSNRHSFGPMKTRMLDHRSPSVAESTDKVFRDTVLMMGADAAASESLDADSASLTDPLEIDLGVDCLCGSGR